MNDLEGLPTIHYSLMADQPADSPIAEEARTFRRELPRLLAAGHEGRWVLIRGREVVGLFETLDEGYRVGRERFLFQPFIVQPVREQQPLLQRRGTCFHAALDTPPRQ